MPENILPTNGELYLSPGFYSVEQADDWFELLRRKIDWRQERLFIYGKWINVPRLMCWYGDEHAHYRYSGVDHPATPWLQELLLIKSDVEKIVPESFNSVMANFYRDGRDSMGCHADDEKELGQNPLIASLSFGEQRLLRFRHKKSKAKLELQLNHGDLLIMAGEIQHYWKHELPKSRQQKKARINLTFRRVYC